MKTEVIRVTFKTKLLSWIDLFKELLRRGEVDRAVIFAVLAKGWQIVAGPITLVLIARYFTPEVQGFYYTFASILALQSFVELGFYLVIINVASHEWAHLSLDEQGNIVGDSVALSRLISLGRLIFKWYGVACFIFIVTVGLIGFIFFTRLSPVEEVYWQNPWGVLVILTGCLLWALPFNSLLEGCNQVTAINQLRLIQSTLGNMA